MGKGREKFEADTGVFHAGRTVGGFSRNESKKGYAGRKYVTHERPVQVTSLETAKTSCQISNGQNKCSGENKKFIVKSYDTS